MGNPTNSPNKSRQDTVDPTKGYTGAVIQQGSPVLDVDLNDAADLAAYQARQATAHLRGGGDSPSLPSRARMWCVVPVERAHDGLDYEGLHARNLDNFAVTLGTLTTRHGVIDTLSHHNPDLTPAVIFDWQKIVTAELEDPRDRPFANVVFRGKVTHSGAGLSTKLVDQNKAFRTEHRLTTVHEYVVVPGYAKAAQETSTGEIPQHGYVVDEPACRIIFTSGANEGAERTVLGLENPTTLLLSSALDHNLAEGDTYVIVPGNAFGTFRSNYNAATAALSHPQSGLATNASYMVMYVQAFLDDVSSDEDPDLVDPTLGIETSHRTALRWCVRACRYKMSVDTDSGFSRKLPGHFRWILDQLEKEPYFWAVNAGPQGDSEDTGDAAAARHLVHQVPRPNALTGVTSFKYGDPTLWKNSGITSLHLRLLSRFPEVGGRSNPVRNLLPVVGQELQYALCPNGFSDIVPLLMFCPGGKREGKNADTLDAHFYPGLPYPDPADDSVAIAIPMVPLVGFANVISTNTLTEWATIGYPVVLAPAFQWLDVAEIAEIATRAMAVSFNDAGPGRGLREHFSGHSAPLLHEDLASHLAWLDTLVLGVTGLGYMQGRTEEGYNEPGQGVFIPSGLNFKITGDEATLFQAGQANATFHWNTNKQLNPSAATQGAITPLDPLVGSASGMSSTTGAFIGGPGVYKTRDGRTVQPDDPDYGWSFYKYCDDAFKMGADAVTDTDGRVAVFERRRYEEGLAQAALFRQSLMFRKLAIKTSGQVDMDMFNYWIPAPWRIIAAGGVLKDWKYQQLHAALPSTGYGYAAVAPLLDASANQNMPVGEDEISPAGNQSYAVGGFRKQNGSMSSTSTALVSQGESADNSYSQEGRGSQSIYYTNPSTAPTPYQPAAQIKADEVNGPWGRFPTDADDQVNPLDVWENRCTVARLRYHIGDYYPGPAGEGGLNVNALVDTLKLYVRIEPLPLVHWATMPKHTHQVLRNSVQGFNGLLAFMAQMNIAPVTTHLVNGDGEPLKTLTSPQADGEVGDVDWHNEPFAAKYQPFVHWYHPNMQSLYYPHPNNGQVLAGGPFGTTVGVRIPVYAPWGERSLIIPGIVTQQHQSPHGDARASGLGGNFNQSVANVEYFRQGNSMADQGTSADDVHLRLGTHVTGDEDEGMQSQANGGFNLKDNATLVTVPHNLHAFPFIPTAPPSWDDNAFGAHGKPGPVFFPAFENHIQRTGFAAQDATETTYDVHPVFLAKDTAPAVVDEFTYFPRNDRLQDIAELPNWGAADDVWGKGSAENPNSAYDWKLPVLRAKIDTSTVAAIVALFRGTLSYEGETNPDPAPLGTPDATAFADVPTDTAFVGDIGMSVALSDSQVQAGTSGRTFYLNPSVLSAPMGTDTDSPTWNSRPVNVRHDAFQMFHDEVTAARYGGPDTAFVPLINTFKALYYAGLSQKLLWNSSFRVLHARPGGGHRPGQSGVARSSAPKSLTELFLVRNRVTGQAVNWPNAPTPGNKPFIHLQSMHPTAAGGGGFNAHPNWDYTSHLYGMVSDNLGGNVEGTPASSGNLYSTDATEETNIAAAEFGDAKFATGVSGDTYSADPFDWEAAQVGHAAHPGTDVKVPYTDRLQQNSGIEVDLVSELRYVRENKAAHGLNRTNTLGHSWTDLMPTVEELTAPGDHEILFVLYTGRFGQKMVDSTVPDGFNPPFSGCRLVATIEVNRPSDATPSSGGGDGLHYGEARETYNILGHT